MRLGCLVFWMKYAKNLNLLRKGSPFESKQTFLQIFRYWLTESVFEKFSRTSFSNAVKYNKAGGAVSISGCINGARGIEISIRDTGIGMDPESVGSIFEPFSRLTEDRDVRSVRGNGLGLSIVKDLVECHEGRITVATEKGGRIGIRRDFSDMENSAERFVSCHRRGSIFQIVAIYAGKNGGSSIPGTVELVPGLFLGICHSAASASRILAAKSCLENGFWM